MKKFVCLALTAAIGFGAMIGFAGCDLENGSDENAKQPVDPFESYTNTNAEVAVSGSMLPANAASYVPISGKGFLKGTKDDVSADLYLTMGEEDPEYMLYFVRGLETFTATGEYKTLGVTAAQGYDALVSAYKTGSELSFDSSKASADGDMAQMLDPSMLTTLKSLPALLADAATETAKGYALKLSLGEMVQKLAAQANKVLDNVTADTTVRQILASEDFKALADTLLKNVKAKDILSLIDVKLPEAGAEESVLDYALRLSDDKEAFAGQLPAGKETFGEFTIAEIAQMLDIKVPGEELLGGAVTPELRGEALLTMAKTYVDGLLEENGLAELILGEGAELEVDIEYEFDKQYLPLSLTCTVHIKAGEEPIEGFNALDVKVEADFTAVVSLADLSDCYTMRWNSSAQSYERVKIGK